MSKNLFRVLRMHLKKLSKILAYIILFFSFLSSMINCSGFLAAINPPEKLPEPPKENFQLQVDSYGNDELLNAKTFFILPSDTNVNDYDLQFIEFSGFVKRALKGKGYTEVGDLQDANVAIFISYGISDPQTIVQNYSIPVWGETGTREVNTTGKVIVDQYNNQANYQQTSVNRPTYGITGYKEKSRTIIYFNRFLKISAFDYTEYQKSKKDKMIWSTVITSIGNSDDLRFVFPYLVAAGQSYFGKSSGSKRSINLEEDDVAVYNLMN